jgi:hypothetical protein
MVLWMVAPAVTLSNWEHAHQVAARAESELQTIPRWQRLVQLGIETQARRHAAVEVILDKARRELDWRAAEGDLVAALEISREARDLAEIQRREALPALPAGSEYRARLEALLPVEPPPAFRQRPLPDVEGSTDAWEGLLEYLSRRDAAYSEGARTLLELRRDARRNP